MPHADRYKQYVQSLQTAVIVPQYIRLQTSLNNTKSGQLTVATGAEVGPQGWKTLLGQLSLIQARLQAQYSPYVWILWESST